MARAFAILDVFTSRPLSGNQLAVVLDADGLDTEAMLAITAEFNLAETVFVLPAERPAHRARIRIFAPGRELPFAGHPTVGTAVLLALDDAATGGTGTDTMLVLEETVGPVRCLVSREEEGKRGHATFDVPVVAQPAGHVLDRDAIAAALGLLPSEIGFENHVASAYTAGVPYIFVPLRDLDAMRRVLPRLDLWQHAFGDVSAYLYCRETESNTHHFHARMFWRTLGLVEDPATGSAAAAFAGVVAGFDRPMAGSHPILIEQGYEMGRPSVIRLEVDIENGALAAARIGGDAVVVARGTLDI